MQYRCLHFLTANSRVACRMRKAVWVSARKMEEGESGARTEPSLSLVRGLWLYALQEKLQRAADTLAQAVRPGKINGPTSNHRRIEPFHKFRQVRDRECFGHFSTFLTFGENFSQEANGDFFGPPHLGGAYRIHRRRKHYGLP